MQMSYGLYWRSSVELAYLKRTSRTCIPFGLIHAKEASFSTKRKVVKDKETHGIKATISTWNVIKIQFNFALWSIDWMPFKHIVRKKIVGRFRLPPQPNGDIHYYIVLNTTNRLP